MEKKQLPKNNHRTRGVTHHLPYRTRYRLSPRHRNSQTFRQIHDSVASLPGVKRIELNERTGSVLIHHEEQPDILTVVGKALDNIAVDLFVDTVAGEEMAIVSGIPLVANMIRSRFVKINNYIAQLTQNSIDLRTILPIALLGAGIYQASRERSWWTQMPAWVLFYYAFDSYIKFHGPSVHYTQVRIPGNGQNGLM